MFLLPLRSHYLENFCECLLNNIKRRRTEYLEKKKKTKKRNSPQIISSPDLTRARPGDLNVFDWQVTRSTCTLVRSLRILRGLLTYLLVKWILAIIIVITCTVRNITKSQQNNWRAVRKQVCSSRLAVRNHNEYKQHKNIQVKKISKTKKEKKQQTRECGTNL